VFAGVTIEVKCGDGAVLGSAQVGEDGMVTIRTSPDYTGSLQLSIVGNESSTYFDEAEAAFVATGEGVILRAIVPRADKHIGITPLTNAAVSYLETQIAADEVPSNDPVAIAAANNRVRDEINRFLPETDQIADITLLPFLVSNVSELRALPVGARAVYARVLAAFADTAAESNASLIKPALAFSVQLAADLTDGIIDDRAANGGNTTSAANRAYSVATLQSFLARSLERVVAEVTGVILPKVAECLATFRLRGVSYRLLGIRQINQDESACRYDSPLGPVNLIVVRYSAYTPAQRNQYCGASGTAVAVVERQTPLGPVYRIWSTQRQISVSHGLPQDRLVNTEVLRLAASAGVGRRCPR